MNTPPQKDVRWKQRFSNFSRALKTLEEAKLLADSRALSKLEQQGLIQGFEFTQELAWNVLKDYPALVSMSGKFDALSILPDVEL